MKAVKGQAIALKQMKKQSFVTPLLCFSRTNLEIGTRSNRINGIVIANSQTLIPIVEELDKKN